VYPKGDVPLHPDFREPLAPRGALWRVYVCSVRQFEHALEPSVSQYHPRFLPFRPCGACNFPEAKCVAGVMGLIEKNWEVYEYACPLCDRFTIYSYFE